MRAFAEYFYLRGNQLRLRKKLDFETRSDCSIGIKVIMDREGATLSRYFHIEVLDEPSPREDVNSDELVTPYDALIIINYLNSSNGDSVVRNAPSELDINRDGHVSPIDVLIVINYLNGHMTGGQGEAPVTDCFPMVEHQSRKDLLAELHDQSLIPVLLEEI